MIGQTLRYSLRTFVLVYRARRQRVVADDAITVESNIRLNGVRLLVRPCELPEPIVESCAGAIERVQIVFATKLVDNKFGFRHGAHDRRFAT